MAELNVIIRPDGLLEPSLEEDWDEVNRLGRGEILVMKYTQVRDPLNHRRYFAMHKIAYDNRPASDLTQDRRGFRKMIEMTAGYRTAVQTFKGEIIYIPKSIKYEQLEEPEFQEIKKACGDVIVQRMGLTDEDLQDQILLLANINPRLLTT